MNIKEIDEAISNNPGGTDLEIALAIGSSEEQVRDRRAALDHIKAKEEAKQKKEPKPEEKKEEVKEPAPEPIPASEVTKCGPPRPDSLKPRRYFYTDPDSGSSVELEVDRINDRNGHVFFRLKP